MMVLVLLAQIIIPPGPGEPPMEGAPACDVGCVAALCAVRVRRQGLGGAAATAALRACIGEADAACPATCLPGGAS